MKNGARKPGQLPPRVVALHASASSRNQWRALEQRLERSFQLMAPDHIGHGRASVWALPARPSLSDHVAEIAPLIDEAPEGVHLIGHSFGGVVALQAALDYPTQVRSLVLYEPVLLCLLLGQSGLSNAERRVFDVARRVRAAVAQYDLLLAAQLFVTYWGGKHVWRAFDAQAQAKITDRIESVVTHFDIIETAFGLAHSLSAIRMPTLVLRGERTTASARRVATEVAAALPNARCQVVDGAGHMGPLTHDRLVNSHIAAFLLSADSIRGGANESTEPSASSSRPITTSTNTSRRSS